MSGRETADSGSLPPAWPGTWLLAIGGGLALFLAQPPADLWLLAWLASHEQLLPDEGPLPPLLDPPLNPVSGHPGDLPVR